METLDNQVFNTSGNVSPELKKELESLHPWMRITSILQIVSLALSFIVSMVSIIMSPFAAMVQIVQTIIVIIIWIFPLIFLLQSAAAFRDYTATGNPQSLLWGFVKQKAFWRYMGILIIVVICLVIVSVLFVAAVGGSMMRGF